MGSYVETEALVKLVKFFLTCFGAETGCMPHQIGSRKASIEKMNFESPEISKDKKL
jgi:hypothetical protein